MSKVLNQEITTMRFATVVSDKKLKGSGLSRGDEVWIMSTKDVAFTKKDPYLKRTLMIVAKVEQNVPLIPSDKNEYEAIVVDPRSLQLVSDEREAQLMEAVNAKYGRSSR